MLLTGPLAVVASHFKLSKLQFPDFAGILALGRVPETMIEKVLGQGVDAMISGVLGILFAFLVPVIGSKYLLVKGMIYSAVLWFIFYPTVTVLFLQVVPIDAQTAIVNAALAMLFGLVLAQAYYWLHTET